MLAREPHGYTVGIEAREVGRLIPCALIQLVGRYTALERWFTEVLPTLPKEQIEEILEELLAHDGSQAPRTESRSYPQNVPLPSFEESPPVTFSALKRLLSTRVVKIGGLSPPTS